MVEISVGLVLIQGPESLLADRAISQIIAATKSGQVMSFTADELEVGTITDSLAPSLFSDSRVVVIKDIQDLIVECSEEIANYLENLDETLT
jgi:DNA polymerase-3 subunit delta